MRTVKKLSAVILSAVMALSVSACNNERRPQGPLDEVVAPEIDMNAPTGTIKYLTYESNFTGASADMITLFKERYDGDIDVDKSATSSTYAEMLGAKIAAGDSPDIVRYEGWAFPHGASYNMFTPLDNYLDLNSDLWKDIKDVADQFVYNGKHFYVPYITCPHFALSYNNVVLQENGMPDPIKYVYDNTWDWNKFEEMLKRWKDIDPVNHISYNGVGALSFAYTTGKKIIDIDNGDIINNLRDPDIVRCMHWLENLKKEYLVGATPEQVNAGMPSGFVDPGEAFKDGNLLFLGMGATWTYEAAKETLDKANIPNEMKYIPFPRDPQADAWYQLSTTYGYLIPAGAKNIKGAVDWITLLRTEQTDPDNMANEKAKLCDDSVQYYPICANANCGDTENGDDKGRHTFTTEENESGVTTCPVCGEARREKYKVVWTEEQYDMNQELITDGERFVLVYDYLYGFSNDFKALFVDGNDNLLDGLLFGEVPSYTQRVEEIWGSVEGYLQPYRDRMQANARGEEVTTTPPKSA